MNQYLRMKFEHKSEKFKAPEKWSDVPFSSYVKLQDLIKKGDL